MWCEVKGPLRTLGFVLRAMGSLNSLEPENTICLAFFKRITLNGLCIVEGLNWKQGNQLGKEVTTVAQMFPPGCSKKNPFLSLFQFLETTYIPWLKAPTLYFLFRFLFLLLSEFITFIVVQRSSQSNFIRFPSHNPSTSSYPQNSLLWRP